MILTYFKYLHWGSKNCAPPNNVVGCTIGEGGQTLHCRGLSFQSVRKALQCFSPVLGDEHMHVTFQHPAIQSFLIEHRALHITRNPTRSIGRMADQILFIRQTCMQVPFIHPAVDHAQC